MSQYNVGLKTLPYPFRVVLGRTSRRLIGGFLFAPTFQCCCFWESSFLFIKVFKERSTQTEELCVKGTKAVQRARVNRPKTVSLDI